MVLGRRLRFQLNILYKINCNFVTNIKKIEYVHHNIAHKTTSGLNVVKAIMSWSFLTPTSRHKYKSNESIPPPFLL